MKFTDSGPNGPFIPDTFLAEDVSTSDAFNSEVWEKAALNTRRAQLMQFGRYTWHWEVLHLPRWRRVAKWLWCDRFGHRAARVTWTSNGDPNHHNGEDSYWCKVCDQERDVWVDHGETVHIPQLGRLQGGNNA